MIDRCPNYFSDDEIAAYRRDGFVVVRGFLDVAAMRDITAWTGEVQNWPETPGEHMMYFERSLKDGDKRVLNRVENFCPYHRGFDALMNEGELPARVGELIGEDAVLFKEKINFKMPGGDGFKPHRDAQAGWEHYASYFINVMVCIDEATVENGCLQLAPGHHQSGIAKEWEPLSDGELATMNFVTVASKPGDICFFDSYAPHQSDPNTSDKIRRLYFATYNRVSEGDHHDAYHADKFANYPPDIDREKDKEYVFRV